MQDLSSVLEKAIETRDAKQVIELSGGKVTFHPDDRGFAYITAKNPDQKTTETIKELQAKYNVLQ